MSTKRAISNSRIIFLPYSFGIEKTSTFIHSRSFLENLSHSDQNVTSLYQFSDQNVIERRYLVLRIAFLRAAVLKLLSNV